MYILVTATQMERIVTHKYVRNFLLKMPCARHQRIPCAQGIKEYHLHEPSSRNNVLLVFSCRSVVTSNQTMSKVSRSMRLMLAAIATTKMRRLGKAGCCIWIGVERAKSPRTNICGHR